MDLQGGRCGSRAGKEDKMKITKKQFQVGSIFKMLFTEDDLFDGVVEGEVGTPYKNKEGKDILYLLTDIEKDLAWGDDAYLVNLEALNCDGMNIYNAHVWWEEDIESGRAFEFVQ